MECAAQDAQGEDPLADDVWQVKRREVMAGLLIVVGRPDIRARKTFFCPVTGLIEGKTQKTS